MVSSTGAWRRVGLASTLLMVAACGERAGSGGTAGTAGDGAGGAGGDAGVPTDPLADASCGDGYGALWDAVGDAELGNVRLGYCLDSASGTTGALIFDSDGRLVDVTGTFRSDAPPKSDWLAMFSSDRFPCFAGQTINYACIAD